MLDRSSGSRFNSICPKHLWRVRRSRPCQKALDLLPQASRVKTGYEGEVGCGCLGFSVDERLSRTGCRCAEFVGEQIALISCLCGVRAHRKTCAPCFSARLQSADKVCFVLLLVVVVVAEMLVAAVVAAMIFGSTSSFARRVYCMLFFLVYRLISDVSCYCRLR